MDKSQSGIQSTEVCNNSDCNSNSYRYAYNHGDYNRNCYYNRNGNHYRYSDYYGDGDDHGYAHAYADGYADGAGVGRGAGESEPVF